MKDYSPVRQWLISVLALCTLVVSHPVGAAPEAQMVVRANQIVGPVSRYLTGACLEDVNHEVYGGLYSQMIFGESFQEPAPSAPLQGFTAYGGQWQANAGELAGSAGDGPKLISALPPFSQGEVGVEVRFDDRHSGNAGLIVKVGRVGLGADNFDGYEISLDAGRQVVRLGRHRHNWQLLRETPSDVPLNRWIALRVALTETGLTVWVDGQNRLEFEDAARALRAGTVGVRQWQRSARYRRLWVKTEERQKAEGRRQNPEERQKAEGRRQNRNPSVGTETLEPLPFLANAPQAWEVSGMWRSLSRGTARGQAHLTTDRPFTGRQSQQLTFVNGAGEVGLENQGLNRWGLNLVADQPYEGYVWARAAKPMEVFVALENRVGTQLYAEAKLTVSGNDWRRLDFTLAPKHGDRAGRFALKLKQPGAVVLGHAFLQPGAWGRFAGLPVRRDVAEALIDQGLTVLRYGGSMVNDPHYRWKNMIGPRDRRPPYHGTWYPYSSNGWGILDFLDFCQAAGFLGIPAFYLGETPTDMADFVEYVNGPAESEWGRRRVAAGHPAPYGLKYLELGNEEAVNQAYWQKFRPLAEAIWAKDPKLIPVVGDFAYDKPITNPFDFTGAPAIKSLAAHQKILDFARQMEREVWFDVHIGTEQPPAPHGLLGVASFVEQLAQLSPGAKFKVVVFEFNAGNHALKRALANASAINQIERLGERVPIACSANCLQPDGQNDNGWNQGLLFLNPTQVWLQPPGYVTRMVSRHYQPWRVMSEVTEPGRQLDVSAERSADGRTLVLRVVNASGNSIPTAISFDHFEPTHPTAAVEELAGPLDAENTADQPDRVRPTQTQWPHHLTDGHTRYTFAPRSFTVLRFE